MSAINIEVLRKTNAMGHLEITLGLEGNLDNSTVTNLQAELTAALAAKPAQLIFDLAKLNYVTSSGIRLFLWAQKQQKQHQGEYRFDHLQPAVREAFVMCILPLS